MIDYQVVSSLYKCKRRGFYEFHNPVEYSPSQRDGEIKDLCFLDQIWRSNHPEYSFKGKNSYINQRGESCYYFIKRSKKLKGSYLLDFAIELLLSDSSLSLKESVFAIYLNPLYTVEDSSSSLFIEEDISHALGLKLKELNEFLDRLDWSKKDDFNPIFPSLACISCQYKNPCLGSQLSAEDSILNLPALSAKQLLTLYKKNIYQFSNSDSSLYLNQRQKLFVKSFIHQEAYISTMGIVALKELKGPFAYLDFETISTPIPLYPRVSPFGLVPTQYSLHLSLEGKTLDGHREYIAPLEFDHRRQMVDQLLFDLEEYFSSSSTGSILVYSNYESLVLREFSNLFPDLKERINLIRGRLFDLEKWIRNHYAHPQFKGKTKLKVVYASLIDQQGYSSLDISEGAKALEAFVDLKRGSFSKGEVKRVQDYLKEYCALDTQALYEIFRELILQIQGGLKSL